MDRREFIGRAGTSLAIGSIPVAAEALSSIPMPSVKRSPHRLSEDVQRVEGIVTRMFADRSDVFRTHEAALKMPGRKAETYWCIAVDSFHHRFLVLYIDVCSSAPMTLDTAWSKGIPMNRLLLPELQDEAIARGLVSMADRREWHEAKLYEPDCVYFDNSDELCLMPQSITTQGPDNAINRKLFLHGK